MRPRRPGPEGKGETDAEGIQQNRVDRRKRHHGFGRQRPVRRARGRELRPRRVARGGHPAYGLRRLAPGLRRRPRHLDRRPGTVSRPPDADLVLGQSPWTDLRRFGPSARQRPRAHREPHRDRGPLGQPSEAHHSPEHDPDRYPDDRRLQLARREPEAPDLSRSRASRTTSCSRGLRSRPRSICYPRASG